MPSAPGGTVQEEAEYSPNIFESGVDLAATEQLEQPSVFLSSGSVEMPGPNISDEELLGRKYVSFGALVLVTYLLTSVFQTFI